MKRYRDITGDGGSNILGQVEARNRRLRERMTSVRHKIAIVSGKGGVGKSSFTANLALGLAARGFQVAALDADINGPSLARMLGVPADSKLQFTSDSVLPARGLANIPVMSTDLWVPSENPITWTGVQQESYLWRGANEANTLREFLADTAWGALDYLLLDLPPGTDRFPTIHELLPDLDGVIILTIPSEASRYVVQKMVSLAKERGVRIFGLVENMAGYVCPECETVSPLFTAKKSAEMVAADAGIPLLGAIPFDPRLAVTTDSGHSFLEVRPDSPAAKTFFRITDAVIAFQNQPDKKDGSHGEVPAQVPVPAPHEKEARL
ncbi:MAG: P-loop NTPase [bacterium]